MYVDKDWKEFTGTVMAIDPSGRGSDETGYAIVKYLNGYLFVVAAGGIQGGYSDSTLQKLAQQAKLYAVNHIVVEANFGDGMWTELFKPVLNKVHPCKIEEIKHQSNKEARIIDTLEPVLMRHKLVIDPKVIEEDYKSVSHHPPEKQNHFRLMYQLTRITKERGSLSHDDRLDALAMAVNYWVQQMARDEDDGLQAAQDEAFQKELDKFMEAAGRGRTASDVWVQV